MFMALSKNPALLPGFFLLDSPSVRPVVCITEPGHHVIFGIDHR